MSGINLLIDARVIYHIEKFIHDFVVTDVNVTDDGLRISMGIGICKVSIYQPERFERYVTCGFNVGSECTFAAETVKEALESLHGKRCGAEKAEDKSTISLNSVYVESILIFMRSFFDELSDFPPPWFLLACEIERADMRSKVPGLAESEYVRKMSIWKKWVG